MLEISQINGVSLCYPIRKEGMGTSDGLESKPSSEMKPCSTLKAYADGSIVITLASGLTWKNRLKASEAGSVVLTKAFCLATTNLQDLSSSFLDYI
jgi:hypothetical protein